MSGDPYYISSASNSNGDIYILVNSEDSLNSKRLVYIFNKDYSYESKLISFNSSISNQYPLLTIIKIINNDYLVSYSNYDGHFEVINYNNEEMFYSSTIVRGNQSTSEIMKNTFISLKCHNNSFYVLNAFIDKTLSKFKIEKLYFPHHNIETNQIQLSVENIDLSASTISKVSCFEIDYYIECLYSNPQNLYSVSIFDISSLRELFTQIIEDNTINEIELFSKCIYIQDKIGAFIYYINDDQFPKLQFKLLEIEPNIKLSDYFNKIDVNSKGAFTFRGKYIYNDFIKTNENNIYFLSTESGGINIYMVLIKLLNNNENIIIKYYNIKLNEYYNIAINKDISLFSLNGLLGLAITGFNHNMNGDSYSIIFILGYLYTFKDISINLDQNMIFNEENIYEIEINKLIENIYIRNNIFGYEFAGIKIISSLNKENGFSIYSNEIGNNINEEQILSINDTISFKIISEIGVKLGNYSIEFGIIIKEPEYDDFISIDESTEYISKNDSTNNSLYESFYIPNTYLGKKSSINFIINECYKTCENCSRYGDNLNHHCSLCSTNYPFSYSTINGNNCDEICPEKYIISENNICLKIKEENEEGNQSNINESDNFFEKEEIKDKQNSIENNCKKYFYIDEESKIHCIEGDKCIDEYPHLDKKIENLCTNCIFKYNNKCYMDCTENTCIKQDINLDTCINIELYTKIINNICFENFQDIVSNIKEMSENNIIIEDIPNLTVYAYDIEKNISYFDSNQLTYIYFNDIQDILIKEFNLNKNDKIYALIVDSPSKYSNSTINDYGYILLLENGTELNILNLSEDLKVKISIPIINLDLANFNYAQNFYEQGYDIYDKNSEFYHDICTPGYLDDNDITLNDRKKEIFPNNVTIGKTNCEYKLSDLKNKRFIYDCYLKDVNINNTNNNQKNNFEEETNENLINYFLDVVNYKVLKCNFLFINIDNFRHNKAVMICTTSIFISILLLIIFFCSRLSKIRILMFEEIPTPQKINKLLIEKKTNNSEINLKRNLSNPNYKMDSYIKIVKKDRKRKILENHKKIQISLKSDNKIDLYKDNNFKNDSKNNILKKTSQSNKNIVTKINYLPKNIMQKKITKKDENNYDDLPFKMALRMDNRKLFYIFRTKIIEKIKILDIFINKEMKEILLSEYFLYLLIDITMNAMLYSDNIVSHKRHNNGKLDTIVILALSAFANILSSIIGYYLELLIGFEEKIFQIKEIKKEIIFLRVFKIIFREAIVRVIIFFILEIIIIIFCTYYLFIFFTIYHKSQMSLLKNYLISLLENLLLNLLIAIIIVILRKIGINFKKKYIYNTSKYLDKHF